MMHSLAAKPSNPNLAQAENGPWEVLASKQDASVNHLLKTDDGGALEARYVRRTAKYWICYLSSHTGCAHSCRFCHLTATRQTMMREATLEDYIEQAKKVIHTYQNAEREEAPRHLNYNFMARGEALSNQTLTGRPSELFGALRGLSNKLKLPCNFLVSTIMPREFDKPLAEVLVDDFAIPYYSLYSLNQKFRKRWLPKAMPGERALELLAEFQLETRREVVLHWAFINGENDTAKDIDKIIEELIKNQLRVRFNLVRYNPYDERHGSETPQEKLDLLFGRLTTELDRAGLLIGGSRIVPRVGFDVKASCGMFVKTA
jgi:23S rRNA (adenine2503-C2)-methyltransferase